MCFLNPKLLVLSLSLFLVFTVAAHAADENEVKSLDELVIEAPKADLRDTFNDFMPIPTSKLKVDRSEIDTINTISIEDTVRYAPNLEIRRRYFGDPNGVISMRGNGNFQTARHMLFVDGFPLHSMLRTRFNGAPQWNFVAADETESVNITYGPFSPKHSGNAMGGVIDIQSREPQGEEWALQTTGWVQDWELFESNGVAPGYKTFFSHGNKIGKLSYYIFYNRLESQSQPTNVTVENSVSAGSSSAVTGVRNFLDSRVRDSIAFADDGHENIVNDLFKIKMNYELSSNLKLRGMVGYLDRSRSQENVNNYIKDSSGFNRWSGTFSFNGKDFTIAENDFDVSTAHKQDLLTGIGASGELAGGWNYDAVLSAYTVLQDESRDSDQNPNSPNFDNAGRLTEFSHTGWQLFELRFDKDKFIRPELSFEGGYHYDHARLETASYNTSDWKQSSSGDESNSFRNSSGGQTDTHAIHGNLGWMFSPKWDLQVGGRAEAWRSFNGFKHESATEIGGHVERDEVAFSPKVSLGFKPKSDLDLRFSLARSTRFPLPQELFENVDALEDNSISSPGLEPEVGNHATIMVGHYKPNSSIQFNMFFDEVTNTIFNDQDITGSVTTSTFVNIDKVRTFGMELVTKRRDFLIEKHDFDFNISYTNSEIRQHNSNSSTAGNRLPRIPEFRAKFQSLYHINTQWDAMVAGRWQDKAFGRIENDDVFEGDGGQDEYFFMDLKTTYRYENMNASLGINNLTDELANTGPHTFPNRTYSIDLKWKFM
jgi:iron complex outermembrane receptor protein|tara:strand:+ start:664 stop:2967 length:2304 start_codon:yes stop_codon:yes gene_type:complete